MNRPPDSTADLKILIRADDQGNRLDRFLQHHLPERSRAQIQGLIQAGHVLIGGSPCKAGYRIKAGEEIRVRPASPGPAGLEAEPIPLEIVYEDDDLAVVDKRAGMVVHQGAGVRTGTLVNALLHRFRTLSEAGGGERPGIVHRLDKQTSGLIVIARNDFSHHRLARQFQNRQVTKKYIALVHGAVQRETGEIRSAIGRDRVRRTRMTTRTRQSRPAHTAYRVLERFPHLTLLELDLKTGRTHQIRVHLSSEKHPVVGDTLYGAPARVLAGEPNRPLPRLGRNFLHAAFLKFQHPRHLTPLEFSSPLPEELQHFLEPLRNG
jgi:23S rRNA pseudouridine1911/1915/1917 synthase